MCVDNQRVVRLAVILCQCCVFQTLLHYMHEHEQCTHIHTRTSTTIHTHARDTTIHTSTIHTYQQWTCSCQWALNSCAVHGLLEPDILLRVAGLVAHTCTAHNRCLCPVVLYVAYC